MFSAISRRVSTLHCHATTPSVGLQIDLAYFPQPSDDAAETIGRPLGGAAFLDRLAALTGRTPVTRANFPLFGDRLLWSAMRVGRRRSHSVV